MTILDNFLEIHKIEKDNLIVQWSMMIPDLQEIYDVITSDPNFKKVLTIGVWEGFTDAFICSIPQVEEVIGIDIHKDMGIEYSHSYHGLREKEFYGRIAKSSPKYKIIFQDSKKLDIDFSPDVVFIDGNHDYEYVKSDTELVIEKYHPKVIIWHDYNMEPGVTRFLNEIGDIQVNKDNIETLIRWRKYG